MVLRTKCADKPVEQDDGLRILVVSWLTDKTGKIPNMDWVKGKYIHEWRPVLAPYPTDVRKWYESKQTDEDLATLVHKYRAKMREPQFESHVRNLATLAMTKNVTILCVEEDYRRCHRYTLALECKNKEPGLKIDYR